MKNTNYIKSIFCFFLISAMLVGCEEDLESPLSNFVGFEAKPVIRVVENTTESFDIIVAASESAAAARTYTIVEVDSDLTVDYTVPSQVTIPANSNVGVLTVTFTDDETLAFVPQSITLGFEDQAGVDFSEDLTIDVLQRCDDTQVQLAITTDNWPDETSWELYNFDISSSEPVASGGPFNNPADDFTTILIDLCLQSGNYGIVVYDSFGDGIEDGGFEVTIGGVVVASGIVPGGNPAGTFGTDTFTID